MDTATKTQEASVIIAYHLEPQMRFWDDFYGCFLTVLSNEYDPETNRSIIQTEELPYAILVDSMTFMPLREPPLNP